MKDNFDSGDSKLYSPHLGRGYEVIGGPSNIIDISEALCSSLFNKYCLEELMNIVSHNKKKKVFLLASRTRPEKVSLLVDKEDKYHYSCSDPLFIPIPKKFAVLEPDKNYFELTLRANILLSVLEAEEKELHR